MSEQDVTTELDDLLDRLADGEGLEVEFKRASGGIPNSIWPTICAFANTNGGWIMLGVDETVDPPIVPGVSNPSKVIDDLYSQMRGNTAKISAPICGPGDVYAEQVAGRAVIAIRVQPAHRRQKPIYLGENPFRGTYVRLHTGDHHCTEPEVRRMIRESLDVSIDSIPLPYLRLDDLDLDALHRYRQWHRTLHPSSPWIAYDDQAFLEAVRGYRRDSDSGEQGITVAGLLMFGKFGPIRDWRRRHLIDYTRRSGSSVIRWDERIVHEEGLFRAFERIYPRLVEDVRVPFRLDLATGVRIDEGPEHEALREALVNLLVHADYQETSVSLIDQTPDGFLFRNPGDSRLREPAMRSGQRAEPRNPELVFMFRLIGLAEEAGTGIPRIMRAWRALGLRPPVIQTGVDWYEFSIHLRQVHLLSAADRAWLASLGSGWSEAEQLALTHAREHGHVDNATLRSLSGCHVAEATQVLGGLRSRGVLIMHGVKRNAWYDLSAAARARFDLDSGNHTPHSVDHRPTDEYSGSSGANSPTQGANSPTPGVNSPTPGVNSPTSDVRPIAVEPAHALQRELVEIVAPYRNLVRMPATERQRIILALCRVRPLSVDALATLFGVARETIRVNVNVLVATGQLRPTYPETPRHPRQEYQAMPDQ